jgi:ribosome-associated protein
MPSSVPEIAKLALNAAVDKKAFRIVLMDLRGQSDVCDFQFICSAENEKQSQAIASAIEESCKASGFKSFAVEGKKSGHWILMDYGAIMVHVFYNYLRDYYALEELYPKAKFVDLKSIT